MNWNQELLRAANKGDLEAVKNALANKANIEVRSQTGATPLMLAALACNKEIVEFLIKNKANVNAVGNKGHTALMFAVPNGDTETSKSILKTLLENGARIDARNAYGETVLGDAAFQGKKELTEYLIEQGADVVYALATGNMCVKETIEKIVKEKPGLFKPEEELPILVFIGAYEKILVSEKPKVRKLLIKLAREKKLFSFSAQRISRNLMKTWNSKIELKIDKKMRKPQKNPASDLRRIVY